MLIGDIGEKRLISEYILPLFNPARNPNSVGDDCAIVDVQSAAGICISTDRVPADLRSYKLNLIDIKQLGYYLAVLNISDLAAAGAKPAGLLLNLAFPRHFPLEDFTALLGGVHEAATEYSCPVVGGDLSDSAEINLVATSVGTVIGAERLYRSKARANHVIFCSDTIGITPTAFAHFLTNNKPKLVLSKAEEDDLCVHFRAPRARIQLGHLLRVSGACSSVMDNTDGIAQSLFELGKASGVAMLLDESRIPTADLCRRIAGHLEENLIDLILGAGADFQLVGTADPTHPGFKQIREAIHIIGSVREGAGVWIERRDRGVERLEVRGWNYYTP